MPPSHTETCASCSESCPHCGVSLQGDPIPQEYQDKGYYGDHTHFSKKIGHEERGVYDGVLYWSCPQCRGKWHRWPEGSERRKAAEPFVGAP